MKEGFPMLSERQKFFNSFFGEQLLACRNDLVLSQAQMASVLTISEEAYINLECGNLSCSCITLLRFLIYLCDNPSVFLENLRIAFKVYIKHTEKEQFHCTYAFDTDTSYRCPMRIKSVLYYHSMPDLFGFPLCPRCEKPMSREYQSFCEHCGQSLDWDDYSNAIVINV